MSESSTQSPTVLEVAGLRTGYDGIAVLDDVDFSVGEEVFAVLGANGAGKTTLLATLARLNPLMAGSITFRGTDISRFRAYQSAGVGLGYVPQERGVFPDLTVTENLRVGGMLGDRALRQRLEEIFSFFPDLRDKLHLRAGNLSGGESRMVACGRALMQDPSLLLLDEPTAGLSPLYVSSFFEAIVKIRAERRMSIVIAEQNATQALGIAHRVMVLSLGKKAAVMDASELTTDQLKHAYQI
ncbi:ABC transporter ATP-binding protein [Nocardioides hungaricus]